VTSKDSARNLLYFSFSIYNPFTLTGNWECGDEPELILSFSFCRELEFHEFCEAVVRVSHVRIGKEHLTDSVRSLIEEFILPNAKQRVDFAQFLDMGKDGKKGKKSKGRRPSVTLGRGGAISGNDEREDGEGWGGNSRGQSRGGGVSERLADNTSKSSARKKGGTPSKVDPKPPSPSPSTEFNFRVMPDMPKVVKEPNE